MCCASEPSLQETLTDTHDVSDGRPLIQWYPGHIAKAERLMSEVLSMVDVVVELRDSRVPFATAHPSLPEWVGKRGHVLVLNRIDSVPQRVRCLPRRALDQTQQLTAQLRSRSRLSRPFLNGTMRCRPRARQRHSLSTHAREMASLS